MEHFLSLDEAKKMYDIPIPKLQRLRSYGLIDFYSRMGEDEVFVTEKDMDDLLKLREQSKLFSLNKVSDMVMSEAKSVQKGNPDLTLAECVEIALKAKPFLKKLYFVVRIGSQNFTGIGDDK